MTRFQRICFFILFVAFTFPNLGARILWQDEAETALVARVVATRGLPYALDERGPISQDWNYQFSVSPLWRWHPWFQFYVVALSFKLFGESAFTARLPFAVLGVVWYWYFLHVVLKIAPNNRRLQFVSATLALLSVPLYLHIRQARYYSASLLFTTLAIDGFLRMKSGRRPWRYIVGSIGLFHSFLPGALALQVALWIDALRHPGGAPRQTRDDNRISQDSIASLQNDSSRRFLFHFGRAFALTLLPTLPWALWLRIRGQNLNFNLELINQHLWQHYLYIHKFIFPFFLIFTLLSRQVRNRLFSDERVLLFVEIIGVNIFLFTLNHPYFFRYLVPIIPLFIMVTSSIFCLSSRTWKTVISVGLFMMMMPLWRGYLYELTHPYRGSNEQLVHLFLGSFGDASKTIVVNYDDFTFRFHTPHRVIGAQELPYYNGCPDAIIIYPKWGNESLLRSLASSCRLGVSSTFPYQKLADDPNPLTHQFTSRSLADTLEVFLAPSSPN